MPLFTIIGATGPVISAKISGEFSLPEITQIRTVTHEAIKRWNGNGVPFIRKIFRAGKMMATGAISGF